MRNCFFFVLIVGLTSPALSQKPELPARNGDIRHTPGVSDDSETKDTLESKIKTEWEALKSKDKKAYADLLAEDYQGIEVDGKGERNKIQAINELADQNVFNYTLWGYKLIPLAADAALAIYESTVQFPPKAQIRFSRVYVSELWVKRAGQWKELHYQETRVR
jgi:hypothetical protein